MKQRVFTFLIFVLSFSSIRAQDVPEVQRTLLTKVTATWCPSCGGWGWSFFEDIIEDNTGKATFMGAHHSGDLVSPAGTAISENFNAPYQPYFFAGNTDLEVTSGTTNSKRAAVKDLVDANALESPVANVGMDLTLSPDGELVIDYKVEFFQQGEGAYYLGLYFIEDKIIANQASQPPNAEHHFTLRGSVTDENFGALLSDGTISAESAFSGSETVTIPASWNTDNLSVAGIIWKKVDETYEFVNVNEVNEFAAPVSVDFISNDILDIQLNPTVTSNSSVLNLNLSETTLDVNIQLYNLNGQIVNQVYSGIINNGTSSFNIPTNDLQAGIYFVNIQTAEGAVATKKLIVK